MRFGTGQCKCKAHGRECNLNFLYTRMKSELTLLRKRSYNTDNPMKKQALYREVAKKGGGSLGIIRKE